MQVVVHDAAIDLQSGGLGERDIGADADGDHHQIGRRLTPVGQTHAGLAQLAQLDQLQHLDLCQTAVSDAGLNRLESLKQLQRLNFRGTKVTDAGMALAAVFGATAVLVTWYGVNFLLGSGMHAYGEGAGGQWQVAAAVAAEWLFLTAAGVRYGLECGVQNAE